VVRRATKTPPVFLATARSLTESSRLKRPGINGLRISLSRSLAFPVLVEVSMNNIIYIIGLVVVVLAILSFFGLG